MWEYNSPSRIAQWKQILYYNQHLKQHVWNIVLGAQQSFPDSSFSSKNSQIPLSLGHCLILYIYYNIYLSVSRNFPVTINKKTNSPNFAKHLTLPKYNPTYLWLSHQYNINYFVKNRALKHSNCNIMASSKNTFWLGEHYSPLSYHDSDACVQQLFYLWTNKCWSRDIASHQIWQKYF